MIPMFPATITMIRRITVQIIRILLVQIIIVVLVLVLIYHKKRILTRKTIAVATIILIPTLAPWASGLGV